MGSCSGTAFCPVAPSPPTPPVPAGDKGFCCYHNTPCPTNASAGDKPQGCNVVPHYCDTKDKCLGSCSGTAFCPVSPAPPKPPVPAGKGFCCYNNIACPTNTSAGDKPQGCNDIPHYCDTEDACLGACSGTSFCPAHAGAKAAASAVQVQDHSSKYAEEKGFCCYHNIPCPTNASAGDKPPGCYHIPHYCDTKDACLVECSGTSFCPAHAGAKAEASAVQVQDHSRKSAEKTGFCCYHNTPCPTNASAGDKPQG